MTKNPISLILIAVTLALVGLTACHSSTVEVTGESAPTAAIERSSPSEVAAVASSLPADSLQVPPTDTPEPLATVTETVTGSDAMATSQPNEATVPPADAGEVATDEATVTVAPTEAPGILRTYEIRSEASEVRFSIDEELLGSPKTVVGRTSQVEGVIQLDLNAPQDATVGAIQINARDLTTDDSFRNRALRSQILDSSQDEFQFITFTPTSIEGLSAEPAVIGESHLVVLTGDLQIRDIVNSVSFEMEVTVVSENELMGFGEAIVLRSDYDLRIPSVPGVANVAEEVLLEIDFVALAMAADE